MVSQSLGGIIEKVYGPYRRKEDGRQHVIHYNTETGQRRTQSYPRYLMEEHLGRELDSDEHVDHVNDDPTDDRLENYQLLTPLENAQKRARPTKMMTFVCPICFREFEKPERAYKHNQLVQGKSGPYCSKSCAGKVGH